MARVLYEPERVHEKLRRFPMVIAYDPYDLSCERAAASVRRAIAAHSGANGANAK